MKNKNNSSDKSAAYRALGFGKITAPASGAKSGVKNSKITGKGDLRGGKG